MVEMGPWEQYCSPSFKVIPGWFIFHLILQYFGELKYSYLLRILDIIAV